MNRVIDRFAVILVAAAAMLWGTDTLFRVPLIGQYPTIQLSTAVVFAEHVILTVAVLPLLWIGRREIRRLSGAQWLAIAAIGMGASALATVLFTMSFGYGHYIETLLLQKLQPLIAIVLATVWLRERISTQALIWIPLAIAGAYMIVIPEPLRPASGWTDFHLQAGLLAVAAATLWGAATVFGRYALAGVSFPTLTSLRFVFGMPVLGLALLVLAGSGALGLYKPHLAGYYLGVALIPGLAAMLLYYRGLASTPASIATLAELAFPVTGVLLNMWLYHQSLTGWEAAGIAILWLSLAALDWANARRPQPLPTLRSEPAPL